MLLLSAAFAFRTRRVARHPGCIFSEFLLETRNFSSSACFLLFDGTITYSSILSNGAVTSSYTG